MCDDLEQAVCGLAVEEVLNILPPPPTISLYRAALYLCGLHDNFSWCSAWTEALFEQPRDSHRLESMPRAASSARRSRLTSRIENLADQNWTLVPTHSRRDKHVFAVVEKVPKHVIHILRLQRTPTSLVSSVSPQLSLVFSQNPIKCSISLIGGAVLPLFTKAPSPKCSRDSAWLNREGDAD